MKFLNWLLRVLAVLGLALLFVPTINLPLPGRRPRIVLLIDNSASMGQKTKQAEWNDFREELEKLATQLQIESYTFSDSLVPVHDLGSIKFDGQRTDIKSALEELPLGEAEACLLVSDGRHNGPAPPTAEGFRLPLWTYVIGEKDLPDISIEDVSIDDSTHLRIRLRATGLDDVVTKLRFYRDGQKDADRTLHLEANRITEVVEPLTSTFRKSTWRIELDSLPDEDRVDNNTFVLRPARSKGKLHVLFIAANITRETEALLNALEVAPRISLSTYVELSPGKTLGQFPGTVDAVIVAPLRRGLSGQMLDLVKGAARKGIPVLFVSAAGTLPQELETFFPLRETRPEAYHGEGSLRFTPRAELMFSEWDPSTAVQGTGAFTAGAGAKELLGKGSITYLAEYNKDVRSIAVEFPGLLEAIRLDRDGFGKFLETTLAYLVEQEGFPFSLEVNEATTASIDLTLLSEVDLKEGFEDLGAWLEPDSIPLSVVPLSTNTHRLTASAAGRTDTLTSYTLNVMWRGNTFRPKGKIIVTPAQPEKPSRGANYTLMAHLASSKGRVIALRELSDLAAGLPRTKRFQFKPMGTPFIVILVGLCFIAEIWYRRRIGLP
ncbi:VWA domain-containing protein [candidate division WOR-3 bacterium]|nr:VWA domain-containing protein [candidate division WOR-3 bacterium]